MWRTGRLLALIVLTGVLGTLVASVPAGPASASDEGDEWAFVALVNQARSDAGLAPLGVLGSLQDLARAQSGRMAEQHRLFHDPNLAADVAAALPDWQRAGENVGTGGDVNGLHAAFMASAGHRANILGDFTYVGIGVVHDPAGTTWVSEEFVKATAGKPTLSNTTAPAPPPPPPVPVTRIAGADGSATSTAVSRQFPEAQSTAVVVARSDLFADALAGGPLAAVNGGPVLLTPPDAVPPDELAEARRVLRPGGTVFLLGGERALSPAIEAAFTTAGLTVRRVAGADRYETAVEVAGLVTDKPADVLLASGTQFADALVAGPAAGVVRAPIVLTAPTGLPDATASYLAGVPGAHRTVIGGRVAVSDAAAAAAGATDRVAGADRYDTSVRVAQRWFPDAAQLSFATGTSFQDALAGAALSARSHIPLVLVSSRATVDYVRSQLASLQSTIVYGTTAAVPDAAVSQLFA